MKPSTLVLAVVVLAALCSAEQRMRIPVKPEGVQVFSGNSKVVLEAFYDLACPVSAASQKTLMSIANKISDKINFRIHLFPLPYHYNGYVLDQGGRFFEDKYPEISYNEFVDAVFGFQAKYFNDATTDLTMPEVKDHYAKDVANAIKGVDEAVFRAALDSTDSDHSMRASWEYGVSRTVAGTPTFMLNGVIIDGADGFNADQWLTFLGQYTDLSQENNAADIEAEIAAFLVKFFAENQITGDSC